MKKTFLKTIFRDLKKNLSRFIAIIAIVALGVGFLIGLLSATPDLQYSVDTFYDKTNTYDIQIKSTIGFSSSDIANLKEDVSEIEDIEGTYMEDIEIPYENRTISARFIEQSFEENINRLELCAGTFPKEKNECIVLNKGVYYDQDVLGEEITYHDQVFKIVGVCTSAVYYYKLMEPTTIGNGNLDAIVYIPSTDQQVITDLYITVKKANEKNTFKKAYFNLLAPVEEELKNKSKSYLNNRLTELKQEAFEVGYSSAFEQARNALLESGMPADRVEIVLASQKEQIEETVWKNVDDTFSNQELKWYVLNRKSNVSYATYKDNSNKVNDVAVVFPFFFFFIAGLIALTSITRMVSEDRNSIGTLKSLGFSNRMILMKYIFYALFACIIGVLIGIFSGVYILPIVIYDCYNTLYVMPQAHYLWEAVIILVSSLAMSVTILFVMIFLCLKTLKEKPNALMVPKAPKAGKQILLERISVFWKHLSFRYKSAIRNVFRFKRNLIMMIVGVGGCTGLMMVAFGLRNSMNSYSKEQYDEVLQYDLLLHTEELPELSMLQDSKTYSFYQEKGKAKDNEDYAVNLYYVTEDVLSFIDLQTEKLPQNGVLISCQLAQKLHYKKGSTITIKIEEIEKSFIVSGVFDSYVENYIIIPEEMPYNATFVKFGSEDEKNYDNIIKSLYSMSGAIKQIDDIRLIRKNYDSMSDNIGIVINVIILCSGALAMIVIYNLTNINIQERIKEIATLKVIGYQKMEVLSYLYREILIMSVIGILFGFLLGPLLDYFVMDRISSPGQYFSMSLSWEHFIYSFLISMVFIVLVFLLFIPKVRKIKMVESLKSVE